FRSKDKRNLFILQQTPTIFKKIVPFRLWGVTAPLKGKIDGAQCGYIPYPTNALTACGCLWQ
ncbi:MAG: hypothetical protein KIG53_04485, partial [Oscillospiraceae bacterium]|nr:hypothetical protein [Oscillospiraceae bacterium]